jgi:hypothetical protein
VVLGIVGISAAPAWTSERATPASPWPALHRPLHLRMPEGECTSAHLVRLVGSIRGAGLGPVYPMMSPWLLARKPNRPGIGGKLAWAWSERTTKRHLKVLVRGRRLDGPGVVRFVVGPHFATAPLAYELRLDTAGAAGRLAGGQWRTITSDI